MRVLLSYATHKSMWVHRTLSEWKLRMDPEVRMDALVAHLSASAYLCILWFYKACLNYMHSIYMKIVFAWCTHAHASRHLKLWSTFSYRSETGVTASGMWVSMQIHAHRQAYTYTYARTYKHIHPGIRNAKVHCRADDDVRGFVHGHIQSRSKGRKVSR